MREKQARKLDKKTDDFSRAIERDAQRGGLPERPKFGDYLRFRFFKKISADTRDYLSADYAYYRDLKEYYFDAKISPLMKAAATVVLTMSMLYMRDLAPEKTA